MRYPLISSLRTSGKQQVIGMRMMMRQRQRSRSFVFELKERAPWTCRNLNGQFVQQLLMLHDCEGLDTMHEMTNYVFSVVPSLLKFPSALTEQSQPDAILHPE